MGLVGKGVALKGHVFPLSSQRKTHEAKDPPGSGSSPKRFKFADDGPAVAPRDPTSLKDLLPAVLARLARESGGGDRLGPVWDQLVGPTIAKNARPFALRDGTLVVRVTSPRWASELGGQAQALVAKLEDKLGAGFVKTLQFELLPPR